MVAIDTVSACVRWRGGRGDYVTRYDGMGWDGMEWDGRWGPAGTPPADVQVRKSEKGRPVWTAELFTVLRMKASLKSAIG